MRGRAHDSSSGMGAAIGPHSGKVIRYATRNTKCRFCQEAARRNTTAKPHDCRKNHIASSKIMESSVAVELFSKATDDGVKYGTYVGDDDSTTEAHLATLVNYSIDKASQDETNCRRWVGTMAESTTMENQPNT